jgi:hypothetical protein
VTQNVHTLAVADEDGSIEAKETKQPLSVLIDPLHQNGDFQSSSLNTMKLHPLNHSQKSAFLGVFVTLFPFFFPNLFQPLGRASPSMFSVSSTLCFLFFLN